MTGPYGAIWEYPEWTCDHGHHEQGCEACWDNLVACEALLDQRREALLRARATVLELTEEISVYICAGGSKAVADERQRRLRADALALIAEWGEAPDA